MGRRILAERVFTPDMLTTKPTSMRKVLAIPDADSGNSGISGLQGFSEQVEFDADRELDVERAGGMRDDDDEYDGLFQVRFRSLKDDDGTEIMDNELSGTPLPDPYWMGAERPYTPRVCQGISGAPSTKEIGTPRIVPLENYRRAKGYYGSAVLGILLYFQEDSAGSTVFDLWMATLQAADNYPTRAAAEYSTQTKIMDGSDVGINLASGANWPCVDGVEMEDGTILIVWTEEQLAHCARIQALTMVTEVSTFVPRGAAGAQTWHVAVERIGSRVVVAYHYGVTTGGYGTYARYSDDGGLTWSTEITLYEAVGANPSDRPTIDLVKGQDGKLYALDIQATSSDVQVWVTGDGATWLGNGGASPPVVGYPMKAGTYRDATLVQEQHGQWHLYTIDTATGSTQIKRSTVSSHNGSNILTSNAFRDEEGVLPALTDADAEPMGMCARSLNQGGFIDLAMVMKDDGSSTAYWSVWVVRLAMWAGGQREVDDAHVTGKNWDQVWMAMTYPTTAGSHPNVNQFTRTLTSGNEALQGDDGGRLRLWNAAGGDAYYSKTLANDSYDDGITALFELQCTSTGEAKVWVRVTSNAGASDADCAFHVAFDGANDEIKLYDRTGALQMTYIPQGWSVRDWNQYLLAVKENTMYLMRSPVDHHREVCPMEPVVFDYALAEVAYTAQSNSINWGIEDGTLAPSGGTSECYWRSFYLANDDENYSLNIRGRRMALLPVGLLANEAFRFNGEFQYDGDEWSVKTRGVYDAENILDPSPSIMWREPTQSGSGNSNQKEFVIDRGVDGESNGLEVPIHGFALFNRNFLNFKVEVKDDQATSSYVAIFDTSGGDKAYLGPLDAHSVTSNRLMPEKGSGGTEWSSLILPAIENSLASDSRHRWFIKFNDGSAANAVYEIKGVTRRGELVFDKNLQDDSVSAGDEFVIFGSEFFFSLAPAATPWYPRYVKLTIYAQTRPDTDTALQLGTLLLGRAMDLDADEWSHSMSTKSNLSAIRSRAGIQQVRRLGPSQRILKSKFSGQRDRGMMRTSPHELFRLLGGGLYPLAWIDDDSPLVNDSDAGHHFPMLARMTGLEQSHRAYMLEEDADVQGIEEGDVIRNLADVGFSFEEVV